LHKIFKFLAGSNTDGVKVRTEDIIFGLDHYGLQMNQEDKDYLKNALLNKSNGDGKNYIVFEDFKDCFNLNKNNKKNQNNEDILNVANHFFFLIQDILGINDINNQKLTKDHVRQIYQHLFGFNDNANKKFDFKNKKSKLNKKQSNNDVLKETDANNTNKISGNEFTPEYTPTPDKKGDEIFAKQIKSELKNEKYDIAKELIDSIDLDGDGCVSLSDFVFLIQNYVYSLNSEGK